MHGSSCMQHALPLFPSTCTAAAQSKCARCRLFFISIFFKKNYKNIFSISHFTFLYPYRPAGGGRDLYVNKNKFFWAEVLGGCLPPPCRAAGPLPPSGGAAGDLPPGSGRQAPAPNIKLRPFLCALIFCPRDPERGEGERRGEGGNSIGETLSDFGYEPQVTNIS